MDAAAGVTATHKVADTLKGFPAWLFIAIGLSVLVVWFVPAFHPYSRRMGSRGFPSCSRLPRCWPLPPREFDYLKRPCAPAALIEKSGVRSAGDSGGFSPRPNIADV